jgi:glycosyltransferase involved in cell wall biosynthesis
MNIMASALAHLQEGQVAIEASRPPRLLIATDAWRPQVNGVVRTLEGLIVEAPDLGVDLKLMTPERFHSVPLPTYPEIRLALTTTGEIGRAIERIAPDAIHIATEGPIGYATRRWCLRTGTPFTTCYHTRFPEYLAARLPVPLAAGYAAMRHFHSAAAATMVATPSLERELRARGFSRLRVWRRGVDVSIFASGMPSVSFPRPIFLTVGRVAIEKNLEAFLQLDLPGTKVVVGDGPAKKDLERKFPAARFVGSAHGRELADYYGSADVFVFPSRTDTFGLVMLEALAAGVPVAAFPVDGAKEILGESGCGAVSEDLRSAALEALTISRSACRAFGARHTIRESARSFFQIIGEALGPPIAREAIGGDTSDDRPSAEIARPPQRNA